MSDKIRGAIFNMLGDIDGLRVLDAFAGSGALGFEAISRGAANVVAIDVDKAAHRTVQENSKALKLGFKLKAIRANTASWSDNNPESTFDIVLCDPPYDNVQPGLLQKLAGHSKHGGLVIYSLPPSTDVELPAEYDQLASKAYGDARVVVYRRG